MTDDNQYTEAIEFAQQSGRDRMAERLQRNLKDDAEELEHLVEIKNLVQNARAAGLADDPAVRELEARAAALERASDAVDRPASEALVDEHDVPEHVADRLTAADASELVEHLEAAEEVASSAADGRIASASEEHHRAKAQEILQRAGTNRVRAARLSGGRTTDETAGERKTPSDRDLTERLAADHDVDRAVAAQLSTTHAEQLVEHLEALAGLESVDEPGRLQERIINKHRDGVRDVLDAAGVDADGVGGGRR